MWLFIAEFFCILFEKIFTIFVVSISRFSISKNAADFPPDAFRHSELAWNSLHLKPCHPPNFNLAARYDAMAIDSRPLKFAIRMNFKDARLTAFDYQFDTLEFAKRLGDLKV